MNAIDILTAIGLFIAFMLGAYFYDKRYQRQDRGGCARCGVDLSNIETIKVLVSTGSQGEHLSMCPPCANKTNNLLANKWIVIPAVVALVAVVGFGLYTSGIG